jgi:hypothetical protein
MFNVNFDDLGKKAALLESFMLNKGKTDVSQTQLLIEIRDVLIRLDESVCNLAKMLMVKEGYFPKG